MSDDVEKRAALFASTALGLFNAGRSEDAARALRQAIHLSPDNPQVRTAFQHIQEAQSAGPGIPKLCQKLLDDNSTESGEEAIRMIQRGSVISNDVVESLIRKLLGDIKNDEIALVAGRIISALLHSNPDAKVTFVNIIEFGSPSRQQIYANVLRLGNEAIDTITSIFADETVWTKSSYTNRRKQSCIDIFGFFLKQIEGKAPNEICVRPISRLLASDAETLSGTVNKSSLNSLLLLIHTGTKEDVKTASLLASAKYLESMESEKSVKLLGEFLTSRIASNDDKEMECAFSVAAALFPISTSVISPLFLTDGFVESLVPSLQGRSPAVEKAAIDLMSAACVDKACRDSISKHCEEFLKAVSLSDSEVKTAASLTLAKLSGAAPEASMQKTEKAKAPKTDKEIEELSRTFKSLLSKSDTSSRQQSVEGLAYTSLTPSVKEALASDKAAIDSLLSLLTPLNQTSILFGTLTTLDNLSKYTRPLTEEEKKMAQLKNYANAQPNKKDLEIPKLDTDPYVNKRCKTLLDAGIITGLVRLNRKTSPQATLLVSSILLSLSKIPAHRGIMAQQGAVKIILQIHSSIPTSPSETEIQLQSITSHALARILISVNPSHVFGSSGVPITSAVPPLLTLIRNIHTSTADSRDLLPMFEAFLALTNLASTTDTLRDSIIKSDFTMIEELLLNHNDMIQRGATELICNLMLSPNCVAKYADGSKKAEERLHVLLALANADDVNTRRAAGGALAMLTEWDAAVAGVLARDNGVKRVLEMCEDEDEGVVHRGVVVLRNLVVVGGENGRTKVKAEGGVDVLKKVVEDAQEEEAIGGEVLGLVVECLQELVKA